jgi:lysyl-tRNA synthetase class 2
MATGKEWWRSDRMASRLPALRLRSAVVAAMRGFFAASGYDEVETPCLQVSPGLEPHLKAFATTFQDMAGGPDQQFYLHTSPEFTMKKLLAAGLPAIWQMARVFRNGERTGLHHPEFTMVEWYRAGASLDQLMDETEQLVRACATAAGATHLYHGGRVCDPFRPWRRLSVAEAFFDYCDMDILATAPDPRNPDEALIKREARHLGISVSESDHWDDVFFKILLDRIEPHLGMGVPTILHSYPVSMAALARPNPNDPRVAERFEAYGSGVELCNAFGELTDPAEQRRRFEADMALKQAIYGESYPIDEDFLAALPHMPESCGIALGLDRLVMLLAGAETIDEVLWAPVASQPFGCFPPHT